MVFQNYAIFPHLNVFENVAFPLRARRLPAEQIRERVAGALGLVRLERFGDRFARQLSGGQQQRVAIARAIVFHPSVVLMDEPLGALDKNLRYEMQVEIKEIQTRLGMTVVYVTHDQEEAMNMSDRIAIMNQRPHRAGRTAGGDLRASRQHVHRRASSARRTWSKGGSKMSPTGLLLDRARRRPRACERTSAPAAPCGTSASLFVRPERVALGAGAARRAVDPDGEPCRGPGRARISFLGNIVRYAVEIAPAAAHHRRRPEYRQPPHRAAGESASPSRGRSADSLAAA